MLLPHDWMDIKPSFVVLQLIAHAVVSQIEIFYVDDTIQFMSYCLFMSYVLSSHRIVCRVQREERLSSTFSILSISFFRLLLILPNICYSKKACQLAQIFLQPTRKTTGAEEILRNAAFEVQKKRGACKGTLHSCTTISSNASQLASWVNVKSSNI